MIENKVISKVLDEQNFFVLNKYNIKKEDFTLLPDLYEFISDYVRANNGSIPDYRTIAEQFQNFEYIPQVADTFQYLCKSLKANTAKRLTFELLQKEATANFSKMNGSDFSKWLAAEANRIVEVTEAHNAQGTNYAINGAERLQWYNESKDKRTNVFVPTPYPTLTAHLAGGFELGDYILLMAYTNRGKSWVGSHVGLTAWKNKFGVLHYSPELSKKQQLNRLDTLNGHFDNVALRNGQLENEGRFTDYLKSFDESNETPYVVKTMEDLNDGLSVEAIEADILMNPDCKVVIIDGFNLMTHKGKDGNRNNMSNTSRALRQVFGKFGVVGIVIHQTPTQAEKENKEISETKQRVVKAPEIHQYSETVAVIQDACTVLTFDQHDGLGILKIAKARQPCVNEEVPLHCNFNLGFITEAPTTFEF